MHILDHISLCICSIIFLKRISRSGIVAGIEMSTFSRRMTGLSTLPPGVYHSVPFPHAGYPTLSHTRYHFVLISPIWSVKNNTPLSLECVFLWFLERPSIFSYVCGPFGLRLLGTAIVQSLARLLWVSAPFPLQQQAQRLPGLCYFISNKALLPTGLASQKGRVLGLNPCSQPKLGLARTQFLDPQVPPGQDPSPGPVHIPTPQNL